LILNNILFRIIPIRLNRGEGFSLIRGYPASWAACYALSIPHKKIGLRATPYLSYYVNMITPRSRRFRKQLLQHFAVVGSSVPFYRLIERSAIEAGYSSRRDAYRVIARPHILEDLRNSGLHVERNPITKIYIARRTESYGEKEECKAQ